MCVSLANIDQWKEGRECGEGEVGSEELSRHLFPTPGHRTDMEGMSRLIAGRLVGRQGPGMGPPHTWALSRSLRSFSLSMCRTYSMAWHFLPQ